MDKIKIIPVILLACLLFISIASGETVDGDLVYIDDEDAYLSAYPHTISSSGYVYFNLTSKQFTGDIDAVWLFNTTIAKPSKPERYNPHWENTTSQHSHTFYNVSSFTPYEGDSFDYGNDYNTNYSYTAVHEIVTYNETTGEPEGSEWLTSNASFDSFDTDGVNYTIYWHNRHDSWVLWSDFSEAIEHKSIDYDGWTDAYLSKNLPVTAGVNYQVRAWVEVPVSLNESYGKYCFAVKPSSKTLAQAVASGTLYVLDPWWNSSWTYYKPITINDTMVNQSIGTGAFPLLVSITDADLADHAQADGDDIVFTDSGNSSQLPHEIEYWNKTTGVLVAWVNVTDIKNVSSINMYYNNSGATNTQDAEGVWDSNYVMVQHLQETDIDGGAGDIVDSTSNNNDGTTSGMDTADQVSGQIDGSLDFDGYDDYVLHGSVLYNDTIPHTYSLWTKWSGTPPTGYIGHIGEYGLSGHSIYTASGGGSKTFIYRTASGMRVITGVATTILYDGQLHELTWHVESDRKVSVYIDGTLNGSAVISETDMKYNSFGRYTDNYQWNGTVDEVRISNIARTPAYIETDYNNTAFPELFISVGAEQTEGEGDTTPPTFYDMGSNNTVAGQSTSFHGGYIDETDLAPNGQYIFSTNNTGVWVNDSAVNFSTNPTWINVAKTLNSTVGIPIGWRIYAFDNASNWNNTPIYVITTTASGAPDTKFEYYNGTGWQEGEAYYYLWFTCFWWCDECANAEQSDGQATLKITNNGTASGTPKMKLNASAPAGIRIFVDDDNTFADAVELTDTYQSVSTSLAQDANVTLWSWANLSGASAWEFETYAIVE